MRSSGLYNTNPILPLQYNNVQYPHVFFIITTSSRGLCAAQQGKSKATEVESIKIAFVSCLSFLSHAFNFFPTSPYSHTPMYWHLPPQLPTPPLQMEIHSTPSSSCSSSSSHLIPPPFSGPEPRQ